MDGKASLKIGVTERNSYILLCDEQQYQNIGIKAINDLNDLQELTEFVCIRVDGLDLFQDVAVFLVHLMNIKIAWKGDLGAN